MKIILRITTLIVLCSSLYLSGRAQSLNSGLVACYPFSGNANDQSGNGHNGTVSGAQLVADRNSNPNSAYQFNGSTDYIDLNGVVADSGEFSISFWSKTLQFKSQFAFCLLPDQTSDRIALHVNYNMNGDTALIMDFGSITGGGRLAKTPMPNMNWGWEHFVYQVSNQLDSMWIFRNNVLEVAGNTSDYLNNKNRVLRIGGAQGKLMFNGIIDDVKIYSRYLTRSEINTLYNTTSINCAPASVNDIVSNDPSVTISPNPSNGSFKISFDEELQSAVNVRLIDNTGKVIYNNVHNGGGKFIYINQNIEAGIYQLVVNNNDFIHTDKIIVGLR